MSEKSYYSGRLSILYLIFVYAVGCGVIAETAYWGRYGINPLGYMDFGDVFKITIVPFAVTLALTAIAGLFRHWLDHLGKRLRIDERVEVQVFNYSVDRGLIIVLALTVVVVTLLAVEWTLVEDRWQFLIIGVAVLFGIIISRVTNILKGVIGHDGVRTICILVLILTPTVLFLSGFNAAGEIISGKNGYYVSGADLQSVSNLESLTPQSEWKYFGHIGDTLFFMSTDNRTKIIVRFDNLQAIVLHHLGGT